MNCLKVLSLILIVGSLTVAAAVIEKNDKEATRHLSEQDAKFLVNPVDIFGANKPTSRPTTVVVKPVYAYPYPHPSYPLLAYPDYPSYRPTKRPSQQQHHHRPPYGYYPVYNTQAAQPLPSQAEQRPPILLVYGPEHHQQGHQYADWDNESYRHNILPLTDSAQPFEALADNQTEFEDEETDNETNERDVKLSGIALLNESKEETDAIAIDADHIKLPFGIQLLGHKDPAAAKSNKKLKQQEALIYLRNFKNGRKLE